MKKNIGLTLIALIAMVSTVFAGGKIPENVKAKFKQLYPQIQKVKWDKEGNNYEAEFNLNKVETSVSFDTQANVLETESAISVSELPKKVLDYVAKQGKKIKEASRIVDAKNVVTYEAEAKGGDMIFDASGNFIKNEKGD